MLTEYLDEAIRQVRFETTEQGRIFATLPGAPGVWAEAADRAGCVKELREVLEEWLILSLKRGETLPVFGQLDLNPVGEHA